MAKDSEAISDADLNDVKGLVAQGCSIPAVIVRGIIARLDNAEVRIAVLKATRASALR